MKDFIRWQLKMYARHRAQWTEIDWYFFYYNGWCYLLNYNQTFYIFQIREKKEQNENMDILMLMKAILQDLCIFFTFISVLEKLYCLCVKVLNNFRQVNSRGTDVV